MQRWLDICFVSQLETIIQNFVLFGVLPSILQIPFIYILEFLLRETSRTCFQVTWLSLARKVVKSALFRIAIWWCFLLFKSLSVVPNHVNFSLTMIFQYSLSPCRVSNCTLFLVVKESFVFTLSLRTSRFSFSQFVQWHLFYSWHFVPETSNFQF